MTSETKKSTRGTGKYPGLDRVDEMLSNSSLRALFSDQGRQGTIIDGTTWNPWMNKVSCSKNEKLFLHVSPERRSLDAAMEKLYERMDDNHNGVRDKYLRIMSESSQTQSLSPQLLCRLNQVLVRLPEQNRDPSSGSMESR
jgi:hypothetical protein